MREHQIVITLKPEQFLQVQKLARNAGAKSMGMFVRQQLLIALGIEGVAGGQQSKLSDSSDMDLEPIKTELKRLHSQLREFVAEAIMNYSELDLENSEAAISVEIQSGLPFAVENPGSAPSASEFSTDEMEKTAQATFAISPRLGAFEASSNFQDSGAESSLAESAGAQDPASYQSAMPHSSYFQNAGRDPSSYQSTNSDPSSFQSTSSDPFSYPSANPAPVSHSDSQSKSPAESYLSQPLPPGVIPASSQDETNTGGPNPNTEQEPPVAPVPSFFQQKPMSKTPWVFGGADSSQSNSSSATKNLLQGLNESLSDDRRDPLSELLSPGDMQAAAAGAASSSLVEDDDSFDVPLSILTRRRQLAAMADAIEGPASKEKDDASTKPASSVPPRKPDKPDLSESKASHDNSPQKDEEKPKPADTQSVSGTYQAYAPLGNPDDDSPISGGPPPKKRQ